ncbi:unnamed protein product, partial [Prorocentrum cordatum]
MRASVSWMLGGRFRRHPAWRQSARMRERRERPRSDQQEFQKLVLGCNKDARTRRRQASSSEAACVLAGWVEESEHWNTVVLACWLARARCSPPGGCPARRPAFEQLKYAEAMLGERQSEDRPAACALRAASRAGMLGESNHRALVRGARESRRESERALTAPVGQANAAGLTNYAGLSMSVAPANVGPFPARSPSPKTGEGATFLRRLPALAPAGAGDVQELILSCNKDGMEHLRRGEHKEAFEQFKYAEAVLLGTAEPDCSALLAVTCNNLGCYYKKVGKFHGALSYLRRALKMEVELRTDEVTLAGTHLNLCAVLSKLEKHDKAVQHSLCALELMSKHVSAVDTDVSQDDYAVLAIAYHNVAMVLCHVLSPWDISGTKFLFMDDRSAVFDSLPQMETDLQTTNTFDSGTGAIENVGKRQCWKRGDKQQIEHIDILAVPDDPCAKITPAAGWDKLRQCLAAIRRLPGGSESRATAVRAYAKPLWTWCSPVFSLPPPDVVHATMAAVLSTRCTWWCRGRFWASNIDLHPVCSAVLVAIDRITYWDIQWSDFLEANFMAFFEAIGFEFLQCDPVPVLSAMTQKGVDQIDLEASLAKIWAILRDSLTLEDKIYLKIFRCGATRSPTRRWSTSRPERTATCPSCGGAHPSARHYVAECCSLDAFRQELNSTCHIPPDWWLRQPRATLKTGWITFSAHASPARRAELQVAVCRMGLVAMPKMAEDCEVGKLHAALSYLRKSLKIEVNLQTDDVTVAGTHLNICWILSKLDKHDKAAHPRLRRVRTDECSRVV